MHVRDLGAAAEQPEEAGGPTEQTREVSAALMTEVAAREGAVTTESGLIYIETQAGTGESPAPDAKVLLHYHGTLPDGKVFDSSVQANEPATFKLAEVVPCFSEGLRLMKVGGKTTLFCPPGLAYGDRGVPPLIPPGAALSFEVELLEILPVDSNPLFAPTR